VKEEFQVWSERLRKW